MTIQKVVAERGIDLLFHFTQVQNLHSILTHGLLPKGQCAINGILPIINDSQRLDFTDGVCLTIGFPNYKMFYTLRQNNPQTEWAVIGLEPRVLWEKDVAFCRENAAKAEVTAIPLHQRKGAAALRAMFDDYEGKPRKILEIPESCPTHPQAEVLVFEKIEPNYIVGVTFNKPANATQFRAQSYEQEYQLIHDLDYFYARRDFAHWK